MADLVVTPLLDGVIGNLISASLYEIKMLWGVDEEVDSLSSTLSAIRAVLEDAEEKQVTSRAVTDWLHKLKDVVYDADDIVDEFATESLRAKLEGVSETSKRKQVSKFCSCLFANKVVVRHEIGSKIKEVRQRLDEISKERSHFHLKSSDGGRPCEAIERLKTGSLVDGTEVFGREADKEKLIQYLMSDESDDGNKLSVLPIVGMGGNGKTTLAQLLYNDKRIESQFEVRAWVCISESFNTTRITKEIIEFATNTQCESFGVEPMQRRLLDILSAKKFIIVLDDVWNEDPIEWKNLGLPFKGGARGSKIIVTTRSEKVAQIMGTFPTHYLKGLSEDDSLRLFVGTAFGEAGLGTYSNLMDIGKKIVRKCGGLPLAIKTLGGLLSTTRIQSIWENILQSRIWDLPESNNGILAPLRLSYHHLPGNLKQCFAYCSLFPKDYLFKKDELVKLWMAQGYIPPKAGMEMEENLFPKRRMEGGPPMNVPKYARHSSVVYLMQTSLIKLNDLFKCKSIRTFLYLTYDIQERLLSELLQFKCLRALSLRRSGFKELPTSIGNLKHLRYLDISMTDIKTLPESISGLYHLQTLKLEWCKYLTEVPKGIINLTNLRHLQIEGSWLTCLPPGIGKLTQLATLSFLTVHTEENECKIGELKDLVNLTGRISISKLNNVANREEAEKADLKNKKRLQTLTLSWEREHNSLEDEEVLEGLQPHINLNELEIWHYKGDKLTPRWFHGLIR